MFIPFFLLDDEQTSRIHPFASVNFFGPLCERFDRKVICFALKDYIFLSTSDYLVSKLLYF